MEKQFNDKVAIITGASSGIGKATALAFANEGAKVVLADVMEEGGAETLREIQEETESEALFVQCDVSNADDVKNMVQQTVKTFGHLDYAFNNAGIEGEQALTADCSIENWDRVLNINLKGVWLCMKYEIAEMLNNGGGAIVNCSSVAGLVGFQGIPAYAASKHGIVGLTKTAALEYAKQGIRINTVNPGVIQTPMIDRFTAGNEEAQKMLLASEPIGRTGRPEEIAEAVVWLCSDKASFVTGYPFAIDGGFVAQ